MTNDNKTGTAHPAKTSAGDHDAQSISITSIFSIPSVALSNNTNPSSSNRFLLLGFPAAAPPVFTRLADGAPTLAMSSSGADRFRDGAAGDVDGRGVNVGLDNFVGNTNRGPSDD